MTDSKEDGLLPCPFCGAPALLETYEDGWQIGCSFNPEDGRSCGLFPTFGYFDEKAEAIAAWNRRRGVAVKPLVWGEFGGEGFVREEAECILGLYRLAQSRVTGEWHWSLNELDGPWSLALPTPEAARDEAQQDYETRIRGALA